MVEEVVPVLYVEDADRAVAWYGRLGFVKEWEHQFEPGFPWFVSVARGPVRLYLSEHTGDARPDTLIHLYVRDIDAVSAEFGIPVDEEGLAGRECDLVDTDGNRLRVSTRRFVPSDFEVPLRLETADFVLEPLGPEHNDSDYDAWTSSMEHIAATPGFPWGSWPHEMPPEENRADLERHAEDFRKRKGFTYTVLDPASRDVIGCVYIYPARDAEYDAKAQSWVRASHAQLDVPLWRAVSDWLAADWPFENIQYAPR